MSTFETSFKARLSERGFHRQDQDSIYDFAVSAMPEIKQAAAQAESDPLKEFYSRYMQDVVEKSDKQSPTIAAKMPLIRATLLNVANKRQG